MVQAKERINKKVAEDKRKVIHEEVSHHNGVTDPLGRNDAWELLGCTEDLNEAKKFGVTEPLFYLGTTPIYCINNIRNRELRMADVETLEQEILNLRWRYNAEPVIIGKTGMILNGQHTLVALIIAEHIRTHENTKEKWKDNWTEEVTVQKDVTFGVEETDEVVNTMDTCRPRSLADVVWRTDLFRRMQVSNRKSAVKAFANAIKHLWFRTGRGDEKVNAYAPTRTHAESVDFYNRHPKIERAVKDIVEESGGKSILGIPPGWASALMYLMGACKTDLDKYSKNEPPQEGGANGCNFEYMSRAHDFWVLLNKENMKELTCVAKAIQELQDPSINEKITIVIRAWNIWKDKGKPTFDDVRLVEDVDYKQTASGLKLIAYPELGGIDRGAGKPLDDEVETEEGTPEQQEAIENAKAEKHQKEQKKKQKENPIVDKLLANVKYAKKLVGEQRILLFNTNADRYVIRGEDAEIAAEVLDIKHLESFTDGSPKIIIQIKDDAELVKIAAKFRKSKKTIMTGKEIKINAGGETQVKVYPVVTK